MSIASLFRFTPAAVALALSGCVSILPEPQTPDALVSLPPTRAAAPASPLQADVNVYPPDASSAFAGTDMAVRREQEIVYLSSMKWADAPARLLQGAVVDALAAGGGPGRASPAQIGARSEFDLRWRIVDLSIGGDGAPAVAAAQATLTNARDRRIIAQHTLRAEADAGSGAARDRAAALGEAAQALANQVAAFVAEATPAPASAPGSGLAN
jgi:ABC-type uncharacterized transport system auxiliary subunit